MKPARGIASVALLLSSPLFSMAAEAVLKATIKDEVSGFPIPCTVTITDAEGKVVTENQAFKSGFRCSGQFSKRLPAGRTRIQISRGFETHALDTEIELPADRETEASFKLQRLVDLRKRGWYAGDSHVHMLHGERTVPVDFDFVALTARAEDLQYLSLVQAWAIEPATPEALDAQLRPRSTPDCLLTWNLEAPKNYYQGDAGRCLGHCWTLAMRGRTAEGQDVIRALLDASAWDYESSKPTFANFESHQLIHAQGGAVFYTHPARWWMGPWGGQGGYPKVDHMRVSNMAAELPLDTLIGPTFDGLDVITGAGEHAANAKAFELWSLLLDHGYRLAATASSDACFDRPGGGVPGAPRTYAFVRGGFSLAKVRRAIVAGRTFVTTGPLLIATMDGQPLGSSFRAGERRHVLTIEAWKSGNDPNGLVRVEVLRNGQPFTNFDCGGLSHIQTNLVMKEPQTAWYCVRVSGNDSRKQVAISGAFYFADRGYRPPTPVQATVRVQILDAHSGKRLPGVLTEVIYYGTIPRDGTRHAIPTGEGRFSVPGTVRLRAEAKDHSPLTLSPFLDNPSLTQAVTSLTDEDLLDWKTFERLEQQVSNVELTFRLQR